LSRFKISCEIILNYTRKFFFATIQKINGGFLPNKILSKSGKDGMDKFLKNQKEQEQLKKRKKFVEISCGIFFLTFFKRVFLLNTQLFTWKFIFSKIQWHGKIKKIPSRLSENTINLQDSKSFFIRISNRFKNPAKNIFPLTKAEFSIVFMLFLIFSTQLLKDSKWGYF
jgi:hypothetical protein